MIVHYYRNQEFVEDFEIEILSEDDSGFEFSAYKFPRLVLFRDSKPKMNDGLMFLKFVMRIRKTGGYSSTGQSISRLSLKTISGS